MISFIERAKLKFYNVFLSGVVDRFVFLISKKDLYPVMYFSSKKNVGDLLTPYIVSKVSNKKPYNLTSGYRSHVLGIGSIMHLAKCKSIVWGTGIIDPKALPSIKVLRSVKLLGVRGELSRDLIARNKVNTDDVFLGDPGLVMPLLYEPKCKRKDYVIGFVPHYIDKDLTIVNEIISIKEVLLIDVESDPEEFIDQINKCDYIVSSSLHGLILADAYGIPNCWVKLSNNLVGGDFKFKDYYTTTGNADPKPVFLKVVTDFDVDRIKMICKVSSYKYNPQDILSKLPR